MRALYGYLSTRQIEPATDRNAGPPEGKEGQSGDRETTGAGGKKGVEKQGGESCFVEIQGIDDGGLRGPFTSSGPQKPSRKLQNKKSISGGRTETAYGESKQEIMRETGAASV